MLSPEELTFIRNAASNARLSLDDQNILVAKQKLTAMYAALPPELVPCKDFLNMQTLNELTAFRDLTLLIGNPPGIARRIPANLCRDWPVTAIPTPEIILTSDADRARELLSVQTDMCPSFLSFNTRVENDGTSEYSMALSIHAQGLQIPNMINPTMTKAALISSVQKFVIHAANSGSTHSFLSTFSEDNKSYIVKELTRRFPIFIQYEKMEWNIPEELFVSYLLLFITEINEQDKLEILQIVKSPKMLRTDNGVAFNYDFYSKYVGEYTRNLSTYGRYLATVNAKSFATFFAAGLPPGTFKNDCDLLASTVDNSDRAFPKFMDEVAAKAEALRQAEPALIATALYARREAQKATAGKRQANQATLTTPNNLAVPPLPPLIAPCNSLNPFQGMLATNLYPGQQCFNCHGIDHKAQRCPEHCKSPTCPLKTDHFPRHCPEMRARFDKIKASTNSSAIINLPPSPISTLVSVSIPDWLKQPPIQYDSGANILASPSAPFGGQILPSTEVIDIADGTRIPITGTSILGATSCLIAPPFTTTLVPQSFLVTSGCGALLYDNKMTIFDFSSPLVRQLVEQIPSLHTIKAINGLYYLNPEQLWDLAKRQIPSTTKSTIEPKASLARYHTIKFSTLSDLVLFWHTTLGHISQSKMLSIVKNKLILNLPPELTETAIKNHFPSSCLRCSIGNIQRVSSPPPAAHIKSIPVGASFCVDYKKMSGPNTTDNVISFGGFTHYFVAIDYQSRRAITRPTKGSKNCLSDLKYLFDFNKSKGYTLLNLSIDSEFVTKEIRNWCADSTIHSTALNLIRSSKTSDGNLTYNSTSNTIVMQKIAIPYHHFTTGDAERFIRTATELYWKNTRTLPNYDERLWNSGMDASTDSYNSSPTSLHPDTTPYIMYDKFHVDAFKTPILPFGTLVVAQYPLSLQTTLTGRGFEAMVIGRAANYHDGIKLFNIKTKRSVIRNTYKVLNEDQSIHGFLYDKPIVLEISPNNEIPDNNTLPLSTIQSQPSTLDLPAMIDIPPPVLPTSVTTPDSSISNPMTLTPSLDSIPKEVNANEEEYTELNKSTCRKDAIPYFDYIDKLFGEKGVADHTYSQIWQICAVVAAVDHPRTYYFKYYAHGKTRPSDDNDYEYTLCKVLLTSDWADFNIGKAIAHAVARRLTYPDMPQDFWGMVKHKDQGYFLSFLDEIKSWKDTNSVLPNFNDIDWDSIDPALIGDLMLIPDLKIKPNGEIDKYKCRMVFRGDRWKNPGTYNSFANSIDADSLMIFFGIVATQDLDMWKMDVKTAFLHNLFPPGMRQFVRRPHGVTDEYLPPKFELGHCVYGHPLASAQWQQLNESNLKSKGFKKIQSAGSVMHIPATPTTDAVISVCSTDDMLFATPFDSPMKQHVLDSVRSLYETTTEDPAVNYLGLHLVRNRSARTIDIFQTSFINKCEGKYPLLPGTSWPTCPMKYTTTFTAEELEQKTILLNPKEIVHFQSLLGDALWITRMTKPNVKYPVNFYSRTVQPNPTLYDYLETLRIMHYCIATKHVPRRIGGLSGTKLSGTVDSSFASHDDLKGQSCYTLSIGDFGTVMMDTKKQTITAQSSTDSELLGAGALLLPNLIWARNFLSELGYDQSLIFPSGTPIGQDNTAVIKILKNKSNMGKIKALNLRIQGLREAIDDKSMDIYHLNTKNIMSDLGTKALSPGIFQHLSDFMLGVKALPEILPLKSPISSPARE